MLRSAFNRALPLATALSSVSAFCFSRCEEKDLPTYVTASKIPISKEKLEVNQKIVHLVRHAKGAHNAAAEYDYSAYQREDLEDALLTEEGVEQCFTLAEESQLLAEAVELVVVSPLNRTIQTAIYSFPHLLGRVPWIARPEIRETMGKHPCDRMTPVSQKSSQYPDIDFDALDNHEKDHDYYKYNHEREPLEHIEQRGQRFMQWLKTRPEKEIVIVTHSGFLLSFVNNTLQEYAVEYDEDAGSEFRNAELRTFIVNID